MTYKPAKRVSFGPPITERLPSLIYLSFAVLVGGVIVYGQNAPSSSRIFQYVVEGDRHRLISSSVCAIVLFVSAVAAVLREHMRGVVLHADGIEMRELLSFGLPRVRRFHWNQIDRVFVPSARPERTEKKKNIRLDLWDGSMTWLPAVANAGELGIMLERVALARAIPVEGGTGMIDDLGNPLDEPESG
jgi:hypothetical protein